MRTASTTIIMLFSALLIGFGFNQLIIPHGMISGGISGVTMIIGYATGFHISWLYLLLNVPILLWGWKSLGIHFIGWSIVSVAATTAAMALIPVLPLVSDLALGAIFGGVLVGAGSGFALRQGASTGGADIIASILTRKRDISVGMLIFILNGSIIAVLGYMTGDWDIALYSLLSIFTSSKIIDLLHIRHVKITAFIVTSRSESLRNALLPLQRGITVIRTRGGYTEIENDMLMTVTTRYELAELRKIVSRTDPTAFVNIVETVGIMGDFRRPKQ